jgi:ubiquitin-protein ligase
MSWLKRISNEYKKITKSGSNEFNIRPIGDSMVDWEADLNGPSDTPFEGGHF